MSNGEKPQKRFDRSIVEGSLPVAVWTLAWPTMLQNVVGGMQGIVDQAMVGYYVVAVEDYSRMIEIDPDQATAYESRGRLQNRLGAHRDAVADLTRAQALNPHLRRIDSAQRGAAFSKLDHYRTMLARPRSRTTKGCRRSSE